MYFIIGTISLCEDPS